LPPVGGGQLTPGQIELVATTRARIVSGLRAVTTAKTLAYATGASLIGLDTLEVIAAQSAGRPRARHSGCAKNQLFAARFDRDSSDSWLPSGAAHHGHRHVAGTRKPDRSDGPGLRRVLDSAAKCPLPDRWPQARTVAQLALDRFLAGRRDDLWQLAPNYCRQSAAEEKEQRNKQRDS
jgi:tRNA A37 threonylcarbamoyladenosine modification protein TsaB